MDVFILGSAASARSAAFPKPSQQYKTGNECVPLLAQTLVFVTVIAEKVENIF